MAGKHHHHHHKGKVERTAQAGYKRGPVEAGVTGRASASWDTKSKRARLDASAGGRVSVKAGGSAKFAGGRASGSARAECSAAGRASADVGPHGANLRAAGRVGFRAGARGNVDVGGARAGGRVSVMAGAEGTASAKIRKDKKGNMRMRMEAGGHAGARYAARGEVGTKDFSFYAEGAAGSAGASSKSDIRMERGKLKYEMDIGADLGLGVKFGIKGESEMLGRAVQTVKGIENAANSIASSAASSVTSLFR